MSARPLQSVNKTWRPFGNKETFCHIMHAKLPHPDEKVGGRCQIRGRVERRSHAQIASVTMAVPDEAESRLSRTSEQSLPL